MSEKLKPCAHCGATPGGYSVHMGEGYIDIHVECGTRGCAGNREVFGDSSSAIEAWNRRHSEEQEPSTFERMMNNG